MASPWGWAPWCVTLGPFFVGASGDDDEIHLHVTYASHVGMDAAFCARLRNAIEAGLENAPVGVITTPGSQIRPNGAFLAASLSAGRYGLLVFPARALLWAALAHAPQGMRHDWSNELVTYRQPRPYAEAGHRRY